MIETTELHSVQSEILCCYCGVNKGNVYNDDTVYACPDCSSKNLITSNLEYLSPPDDAPAIMADQAENLTDEEIEEIEKGRFSRAERMIRGRTGISISRAVQIVNAWRNP